jgi:acetylornithine deacetylase/succinyl-diaminopimelate desuccinylase-like protein
MDKQLLQTFINDFWNKKALPGLCEFIKIPNQSPEFDNNWEKNGYMDDAANTVIEWCKENSPKEMKIENLQTPGRTPFIVITIPGNINKNILFYGHIDKQPPGKGWDDDLGPYKPTIKNNRIYGRGTVDDGYAVFTAITAVLALQRQNIDHPNIQIMLEASEESGSIDLPFYLENFSEKIHNPDRLICLDSGCGDYKRLWLTTSLRGMLSGKLTVKVLTEGVHSGLAGGIIPSTSSILIQQLQKITNHDFSVKLPELQAIIPSLRQKQIKDIAKILGISVYKDMPFSKGVEPLSKDIEILLQKQAWGNACEIIGIDGIPSIAAAGNVHIAEVSTKISIRLPPTCSAVLAANAVKTNIEKASPYNTKTSFTITSANDGWHGSEESKEDQELFSRCSKDFFGNDCAYMGEGGSIPIINLLSQKFPKAKCIVTGVLGPHGNAHGPNEFLSITAVKKFSACISSILAG